MINSNNVGLVLEGGGMRGAFTTGVLDCFLDTLDKEFTFHTCMGVSAGAIHACSFLSKQKGRGLETNIDYIDEEQYGSFKNLIKTGDLFDAEFCYKTIPEELNPYDYKTFEENPTEFYVVVTNCNTGEAEYKKIIDMHKGIYFVRASGSLPLVSRTVWIQKQPYLDGGIADSIPIRKSQELGNTKNIVVLTRHRGYQKGPNKLMPMAHVRYGKEFPQLVEKMKNRYIRYNETLEYLFEQEKIGNTFIICPKEPVEIGRVEKDKEKLQQLYQHGYDTAKEQYKDLKKFLELE